MILRRILGFAPITMFGFVVPLASAGGDDAVAAAMAADRARGAAMLATDTKALGGILADDFKYTHSNGHLETKASHLGTYDQGLRYTKFVTSNVTGQSVTPDVVVLNGTIDQIKVRAGKIDEAHLLFQSVWRRKSGAWQVVSLQTAKPPAK